MGSLRTAGTLSSTQQVLSKHEETQGSAAEEPAGVQAEQGSSGQRPLHCARSPPPPQQKVTGQQEEHGLLSDPKTPDRDSTTNTCPRQVHASPHGVVRVHPPSPSSPLRVGASQGAQRSATSHSQQVPRHWTGLLSPAGFPTMVLPRLVPTGAAAQRSSTTQLPSQPAQVATH